MISEIDSMMNNSPFSQVGNHHVLLFTFLGYASYNGQKEIVQYLLKKSGIDIDKGVCNFITKGNKISKFNKSGKILGSTKAPL
mmetsp:Transcript_3862/g.5674  ORF Transcript_3862/g.5674 Transcript_3862/m.5674 type:complete len:83 (+) Transcript_3862:77-325(+)